MTRWEMALSSQTTISLLTIYLISFILLKYSNTITISTLGLENKKAFCVGHLDPFRFLIRKGSSSLFWGEIAALKPAFDDSCPD